MTGRNPSSQITKLKAASNFVLKCKEPPIFCVCAVTGYYSNKELWNLLKYKFQNITVQKALSEKYGFKRQDCEEYICIRYHKCLHKQKGN